VRVVEVVPFEEEDESQSVGLLQVTHPAWIVEPEPDL
jgi:hypothetical protein